MTFTVGMKDFTRGEIDGSNKWAYEIIKDSGTGDKPLLVLLSKDGVERIERYAYHGLVTGGDEDGDPLDLINNTVLTTDVWYLLTETGIDTERYAAAEDAAAHFKFGINLASILNFKRFSNGEVKIEARVLDIQPEPKITEPTPELDAVLASREKVYDRFIKNLTENYSGPFRADAAKLTGSTSLLNGDGPLFLDSLDQVEIIMMMEDAFGIQITDEEGETVRTIDDAVNLIWSKLS